MSSQTSDVKSASSNFNNVVVACSKPSRMQLQTLFAAIKNAMIDTKHDPRELSNIKKHCEYLIDNTITGNDLVKVVYRAYRTCRSELTAGNPSWSYDADFTLSFKDCNIKYRGLYEISKKLPDDPRDGDCGKKVKFMAIVDRCIASLMLTFSKCEEDEDCIIHSKKIIQGCQSRLGLSPTPSDSGASTLSGLLGSMGSSGIPDMIGKFAKNPTVQEAFQKAKSEGLSSAMQDLSKDPNKFVDALKDTIPENIVQDITNAVEDNPKLKEDLVSLVNGNKNKEEIKEEK